jgi:hypothetical protein
LSTGASAGYLHVENVQTKATSRLDQMPATFVLDGASAAFNDSASLSVWLIDDIGSGTPARLIARGADQADHLEYPTLNPRIVAWDQSTATQVFDRSERRLVRLPMEQGVAGVTVCGRLIVWEDAVPVGSRFSQSMFIIDSAELPVRP